MSGFANPPCRVPEVTPGLGSNVIVVSLLGGDGNCIFELGCRHGRVGKPVLTDGWQRGILSGCGPDDMITVWAHSTAGKSALKALKALLGALHTPVRLLVCVPWGRFKDVQGNKRMLRELNRMCWLEATGWLDVVVSGRADDANNGYLMHVERTVMEWLPGVQCRGRWLTSESTASMFDDLLAYRGVPLYRTRFFVHSPKTVNSNVNATADMMLMAVARLIAQALDNEVLMRVMELLGTAYWAPQKYEAIVATHDQAMSMLRGVPKTTFDHTALERLVSAQRKFSVVDSPKP